MRAGLALMGLFTMFWSAWAVFSDRLVLVVIGVSGIGAGLVLLLRRAALPSPGRAPSAPPAASRTLALALAVESIAVLGVVLVLRALDPDLVQPGIAVVVGLHFMIFYFSPSTRGRLHLVTTAVSVLVGVVGLVAVTADQSASTVHGLVGTGMSCVTLTYGVVFDRALTGSTSR